MVLMMIIELLKLPAAVVMISDVDRKRCWKSEEVLFSARCGEKKPQTDVNVF
jgi:hypothetical protein